MPTTERTPTMKRHTGARRWLRRGRGWWPDRNPPRRRCDRAEAAIVTALVAVFLAGAPLLALSAGRWAPDDGPRPGHARRAGWHQVPAVLRTATINRFAPSPVMAWAHWTAPAGCRGPGGCSPRRASPPAPSSRCGWMRPGGWPARPPCPGRPAAGRQRRAWWPCSCWPNCSAAPGWPPTAWWTGAAWRRGTPHGGPSARPGAVPHDPPADRRRDRTAGRG